MDKRTALSVVGAPAWYQGGGVGYGIEPEVAQDLGYESPDDIIAMRNNPPELLFPPVDAAETARRPVASEATPRTVGSVLCGQCLTPDCTHMEEISRQHYRRRR